MMTHKNPQNTSNKNKLNRADLIKFPIKKAIEKITNMRLSSSHPERSFKIGPSMDAVQSRRSFIKAAGAAGIGLFLFKKGILSFGETAFASEEDSMNIPQTTAEVRKMMENGHLTNVSWDSVEAWGYNVDVITTDEWDVIVSYLDGKWYQQLTLRNSTLEENGGVFTNKKAILTISPAGHVFTGKNIDGIYPYIVVGNEATESTGKRKNTPHRELNIKHFDIHEIKLMRGDNKNAFAIMINETKAYYMSIDLITGNNTVQEIPMERALEYFDDSD